MKNPDNEISNMRKSTDEEYYYSGQSHYDEDSGELFTPEEYEDERESTSLGSPTSLERKDWETDEDYNDRMEDLGYDPD